MRSVLSILFLCLVISCQVPKTEIQQWEEQASRVTIIRDDFGVPHVYGKTDADAVFGMLYAQCEDDFARVERNYIWAIGRLAEVEGEEMLYSDIRANLFMTQEEAIQRYEESPEWLKKLCQAFADGINYYLYTHPEVQPKLLLRFEPWMPMYFSEGSIGGDIESVSIRSIREFYDQRDISLSADLSAQHDGKKRDVSLSQSKTDQLCSVMLSTEPVEMSKYDSRILDEPQGSNGFAISGKLTESGNAMLLVNPHTSFYFRGEIHVVSEEGLNAYGAVTWGQFFIYQGFNEKNGWMHTSSYTDVMDEFLETIIEKEGRYYYQYGDEQRTVEEVNVTLNYTTGDSIQRRDFTLYRTHHGPITGKQDDKWLATAMMWDPSNALQQAFIRTKTSSYEEFKKMMDYRTNSSNNTVYADADGNIAFFQGNFIPKRDVQFNYENPVEGSNPATDWQGLHSVDESIHLLNPGNGWIQNCNSTPFTSAAEYSPKKEDYPYYMATEPENFRGVHAIKVLTGSSGYTLDKLLKAAYDPYLPAFEKLIPGLVEAFDKSGKNFSRLKSPVDVLRNWDMNVSKESVGMTLAHYYISAYLQKGPRPEGLTMMERVNYFGTNTSHEERLTIFSEVIDKITTDFGTWEMPWGEVNRFQRLDGAIQQKFDDDKPSIPVGLASGNWGALASYGARGNQGTKKIYGTYGNSFVAVVEFGPKVKAKSILAGGQSSDPASPYFTDQAQRYADVDFKDVAYYREDVEKRAKRTYYPGQK
ncbi:MAG: penicillin acylase family protein [Cyclobacteriaceae bacterium]|nr:penicillin acylase family protein [Cyclobacteriaceae bacterium]